MRIDNKKYLYSNGSPISNGGGFEMDITRKMYKTKGIDIPPTQLECSYPFILSQKLGLECINESGWERTSQIIETTKEWLDSNKDKIGETIFILELKEISESDSENIISFINYLNEHKIDYIISIPKTDNKDILNTIPNENNLYPILDCKGIYEYGLGMGLLIKDEIPLEEFYLSWAGNNNISNLIYKFIKQPKKSIL